MHQCLQVPEISGSIVEYLERKDAFRLALTSKSLLETSLNQIWRRITSFKPLAACSPPDIWIEEIAYTRDEHDDEDYPYSNTLLHLRRVLSAKHICRCLTYYAPRIRGFSLDVFSGMKLPSMETLRALELLTAARPGALSPHLKEFIWYDPADASLRSSLSVPILHAAAIELSIQRLGVSLTSLSVDRVCMELIEQSFANSGFVKLIELEDTSQLDVSPLFAFGNLVHMIIQLHVSILVTPSIVAKIPTAWLHLQSLVLCQRCSTRHVPLVTHEHVLQLTGSLPRLRELGLRLDATRIPEPSEQRFASGASRLLILRVGGSPICSPSRTVAYLRANFLFLDVLDINHSPRPSEGKLFVQRWKAVKNQWEASKLLLFWLLAFNPTLRITTTSSCLLMFDAEAIIPTRRNWGTIFLLDNFNLTSTTPPSPPPHRHQNTRHQPCLDRVWEAIDSFAPLIACLPLDLWRNETFPSPEGHDHEYTLLHLERALTAEDMHRYQTYYATRIREFSLDLPNGIELPSLEFLQALNILADSRPGFLSPRLKKFVWYGYNDAAGLLGDGILEHLAPYMFLFLGETVDSLEVDFELEEPILHTASLKLSMRQLGASLRHLSFCGEARINECLKDYKFPNLTRIDVYRMLPTTIPLLATLPQLHTLHIHSIYGGQVPPPLQRATIGFASLRRAFGAGRISDCKRILPQLPPCNALQELEWELDVGSLRVDLQDALEAAEVNCNPLTLTRVAMWRTPLFWTTKDESVEIEDPDQVNLSPLYPFKQLEHLGIPGRS
ncbi:hypothetical protein NMY22_g7529 [Coprinellus aureogranulatus]|nr:hypothetical protein NMY22_g7529 [Coprinellus aureogranulatus]